MIAYILGNMNHQNEKLLSLNLSNNAISDIGAIHLAKVNKSKNSNK